MHILSSRRRLSLLGFACALCLTAPIHAEEAKEDGTIKVEIRETLETKVPFPVSVTLYLKGEPMAMKDIAMTGSTTYGPVGGETFKGLPNGTYELRCEAPGCVTISKKVFLRAGDNAIPISTEMAKGEGVTTLGAGPSIQDLEARIKKIEEARK